MNLKYLLLAAATALLTLSRLDAVILFGTSDPAVNTTAPPPGNLGSSGWDYEGQWGAFLGTVIAPQYFITANHIGGGLNQPFVFRGATYTTIADFADPSSDLHIWKVDRPFPIYAQLYTSANEVGQPLVVIGRGTERGGEVDIKRVAHGWYWGAGTSVQRWGQNTVASIVPYGGAEYLYATFDQPQGRPKSGTAAFNEAHLSAGDSGGAVFIQESGIWKLAGINYAVDGHFYTSPSDSTVFDAALFDARGFYEKNDAGNFVLISGKLPAPTGFYATRISSRMAWILSVIQAP